MQLFRRLAAGLANVCVLLLRFANCPQGRRHWPGTFRSASDGAGTGGVTRKRGTSSAGSGPCPDSGQSVEALESIRGGQQRRRLSPHLSTGTGDILFSPAARVLARPADGIKRIFLVRNRPDVPPICRPAADIDLAAAGSQLLVDSPATIDVSKTRTRHPDTT
jgi:hypothetical protein